MDSASLSRFVENFWEGAVMPALIDYIRIPAKSPLFDPDWAKNGHLEKTVALAEAWCRAQTLPDMKVDVVRLPGLTPVLLVDIPGTGPGNVLLYGHLDKQPEMTGWRDDLGPWLPVVENDRLYGRGGADDGYALFSAFTAIRALHEQQAAYPRCLLLIENSEESGSPDLAAYVDHLAARIGTPDLVVCLDSGTGNYEQLWCTTSLRGLVGGNLFVEVLTEGIHSGDASGIVPSSFRIARMLLSRLEDENTGRILPEVFYAPIPPYRAEQTRAAAAVLGQEAHMKYPFVPGVQAMGDAAEDRLLSRAWKPYLGITGAAGLPPLESSGNVLRPQTALKISLRLPPTVNAEQANQALKHLFETDPPYGAKVRFEPEQAAQGWDSPALAPWLAEALERASLAHYGKPAMHLGEGVTVPFMSMLGRRFPRAQFVVTGVLGPHSNAHGPNEFLHLPFVKKLTCCVAEALHALARA
jgi:acetylornithine deacetylase/succinyl-diaminopimelate desuccinylase-like protein